MRGWTVVDWVTATGLERCPQHRISWVSSPRYLLAQALAKAGQFREAAQLVDQTLAALASTSGRWCEAELHRLRGDLLLRLRPQKLATRTRSLLPSDRGRAFGNCEPPMASPPAGIFRGRLCKPMIASRGSAHRLTRASRAPTWSGRKLFSSLQTVTIPNRSAGPNLAHPIETPQAAMSHETLATGVCSNVAHPTGTGRLDRPGIGRGLLRRAKTLEDQLANEIIVVTRNSLTGGFAKDAVRHCVTLMPKITDACEPFFVLTAISKKNCG